MNSTFLPLSFVDLVSFSKLKNPQTSGWAKMLTEIKLWHFSYWNIKKHQKQSVGVSCCRRSPSPPQVFIVGSKTLRQPKDTVNFTTLFFDFHILPFLYSHHHFSHHFLFMGNNNNGAPTYRSCSRRSSDRSRHKSCGRKQKQKYESWWVWLWRWEVMCWFRDW